MKCGSHDRITRESRMFHWRPAWARYLVICLVGLLIMLFTTQSATLEIPLCPSCTKRWSSARAAQIASFALLGAGLAAWILTSLDNKRIGGAVLLCTVAVWAAVNLGFVRKRMLRASMINEKEMGVLGVHATAIEETLLNARPQPPPPTSAS